MKRRFLLGLALLLLAPAALFAKNTEKEQVLETKEKAVVYCIYSITIIDRDGNRTDDYVKVVELGMGADDCLKKFRNDLTTVTNECPEYEVSYNYQAG